MEYYVYCYLDPRVKGEYVYGDYTFEYVPIYVGKGKGQRASAHLWESTLNRDGNKKKVNKLRKIVNLGLQPILVKLHEGLTESEALLLEMKVIATIGTEFDHTGTLTNLTAGGETSPDPKGMDIETKQRVYEERRQRMLTNNPMKNPDTAKKVSEYLKTVRHDDEYKKNMSESVRNSIKHKESVQSDNNRLKQHDAQKKNMVAVDQYDKYMNYINSFESIALASRSLKIKSSDIMAVLSGRQKTTKGFIFRRKEK